MNALRLPVFVGYIVLGIITSPFGAHKAQAKSRLCNSVDALASRPAPNPFAAKQIQAAKIECPKYESLLVQCQNAKSETDTNCAESENKNITNFLSMMGNVADMAGLTMSQSCSQLATLLKYGQGALAGFRAQCLTVRGTCVDVCSDAEKAKKKVEQSLASASGVVYPVSPTQDKSPSPSKYESEIENLTIANCEDKKTHPTHQDRITCLKEADAKKGSGQTEPKNLQAFSTDEYYAMVAEAREALAEPTDLESPTKLKSICNNTMKEVMGKVGVNLTSLMSSMQSNQACAKTLQAFDPNSIDLGDCNLTGTCKPNDIASDCTDPAYKNSVYCMNGLTTGNTTGGTNGGLNGGATNGLYSDPGFGLDGKGTLSSLDGGGGGSGGFDPNDPNNPFNRGGGGDAKSAGVPGGGGSGMSIPGGGYNPGRGGGGRGVSSDGSGSSGGNPSYATGNMYGGSGSKSDLDKYLPGGEKDPNLNKKGVGPAGITSPGGLTLFEKVSKGYRNSRGTLIPE